MPGFCVDLTTLKPDSDTWDLSRDEDIALLKKMQKEERPTLLIGSPFCTGFCKLLLI